MQLSARIVRQIRDDGIHQMDVDAALQDEDENFTVKENLSFDEPPRRLALFLYWTKLREKAHENHLENINEQM